MRSAAAAGDIGGGGGAAPRPQGIPFHSVASVLSPLLAQSLGVPPASVRSFLRIDEMSLDLLSPLAPATPLGHFGGSMVPSTAASVTRAPAVASAHGGGALGVE